MLGRSILAFAVDICFRTVDLIDFGPLGTGKAEFIRDLFHEKIPPLQGRTFFRARMTLLKPTLVPSLFDTVW